MKVVLLGTGGYYPTNRRHTACLMLPEVGVVLDAGSGMCQVGKYLETDRLEVFLSHAHLDHVVGLTYLVNLVPGEVLRQTTVRGEAAKLEAVREHLFAESIFPVPPPFRFVPIGESCSLPRGGTLRAFALKHPGGSLGFRLDWPGQSMAYVTDTTATGNAAYLQVIHGVDLLVHESYFARDEHDLPAVTGHSALPAVAELAAAAEVARVVLVHIDPQAADDNAYDLMAARRTFGQIELGRDGMELEF
jgi:ribonuclease BN (tRNA processing enzyme)